MSKWDNNEEIQLFREYLRLPSVHPNVDYKPCVQLLRRQAAELELSIAVHYPVDEHNPVVVLTWPGSQPELPSIILNSHMDVVPVFEEFWTHPPFGADIDADGKIFARGAQDMKCVGTQYLAAIRALKRGGVKQLKRTVHLTYVPDEEVGGHKGMEHFVHRDAFKSLNVGFSLDEGLASPTDEYHVYYAERTIWQITFQCLGQSGHGSLLFKNTPGEKIDYLVSRLMAMRAAEVAKLDGNPALDLGEVTSINLTMLSGGQQENVVPPQMNATFDFRLANDIVLEDFERQINDWCKEAGGVQLHYIAKQPRAPVTATDASNPFWVAFKSATDELGIKMKTKVFPGGTDSRYIRRVNIPAIGFSPIRNTPVLLHDHDEYLHADTYLEGIELYKTIITKLANC